MRLPQVGPITGSRRVGARFGCGRRVPLSQPIKPFKLGGEQPRQLGPNFTERNRIVRRPIPYVKFIAPESEARTTRKCKSRIKE